MRKLDILSLIACRDVLLDAKRRIQLGYNIHICSAITRSRAKCANNKTKSYLVDWISTMLGSCGTYMEWLYQNHPETLKGIEYFHDVNPGRLQWLDWMIGQLETEIEGMKA